MAFHKQEGEQGRKEVDPHTQAILKSILSNGKDPVVLNKHYLKEVSDAYGFDAIEALHNPKIAFRELQKTPEGREFLQSMNLQKSPPKARRSESTTQPQGRHTTDVEHNRGHIPNQPTAARRPSPSKIPEETQDHSHKPNLLGLILQAFSDEAYYFRHGRLPDDISVGVQASGPDVSVYTVNETHGSREDNKTVVIFNSPRGRIAKPASNSPQEVAKYKATKYLVNRRPDVIPGQDDEFTTVQTKTYRHGEDLGSQTTVTEFNNPENNTKVLKLMEQIAASITRHVGKIINGQPVEYTRDLSDNEGSYHVTVGGEPIGKIVGASPDIEGDVLRDMHTLHW